MDPIFKQFCMIITYLCTNYCRYFSFDTKILYFRIFYSSRNHLNHVYKVQSLYHKTSFWYLTTVYKLGQLALTGKSLSEALIFASNPQYDNRLFIELQVQYMKIPSSNLGRTCCVQKLFLTFRSIFVHNIFSPLGPCSAKRRASDKDLPVHIVF